MNFWSFVPLSVVMALTVYRLSRHAVTVVDWIEIATLLVAMTWPAWRSWRALRVGQRPSPRRAVLVVALLVISVGTALAWSVGR